MDCYNMENKCRRKLDLLEAKSTFAITFDLMMCSCFKKTKTLLIEPGTNTLNYRTLFLFINESKSFKYDPKNGAHYQIEQNG